MWVEDLGNDGHAGLALRAREQLEPFLAEALEVVGRRARLERAAAQHVGAGLLHRVRGLEEHLLALHRAWSGHDDQRAIADPEIVDGSLVVKAGPCSVES